ncbi:agmatinase [Pseudomonas chengduensis]|jgi:agmatinase|uniref:Agmatinase n=1 Tax=Ectopseudomonas chengduensis TaxID=489632 RepID=A0A1G6VH67_9GAMM|nr:MULTISPECIES: agmatinase [Pseudomonas]KQO43279.1 agmatinase [Pseudomonas sp. Leaf83]MBP3063963.1 agmatinase [Pseudomonas chengduensis]MDH0960185.1 agmatinase [Pseudomonas chengduensis]MDH1537748.1 agmatinase [Pseudomonas chengduensis]NNB77090.1 agmatinase [Pseudomonas chengduensis]
MDQAFDNDQAITRASLYGTAAEPTYAGITSFMRRRYSRDLTGVDLAISGVPFDTATTNRPGSRFGPRAIRAASIQSAWARHFPWEFDPFDLLACVDYGDCYFDHGTPQDTPALIEAHATRILEAGSALLTLGGDHFISYPLLKAHARKHGTLALIHFDAHSDTWPDEEGKRIDHGTMFYHAAREGLVDPARSVQIGLRTTNDDVMGFQVLDAREVHRSTPEQIAERIRARVGEHPVYLTFDIDCLDPAFAPGTGTPVCGGLSSHQALEILRGLRGINLVGMDVVEVAPPYDNAEVTALAGAALAMEMICLYAARHKLDERT